MLRNDMHYKDYPHVESFLLASKGLSAHGPKSVFVYASTFPSSSSKDQHLISTLLILLPLRFLSL